MTHDGTKKGEATLSGEGAQATSKRPYHTPKLRHLGSVRELTLGVSNGMMDLGVGMMMGA